MITTVTRNQFLTALTGIPVGDILLEDGTSFLLLEDGVSLLTQEVPSGWYAGISADANDPSWIELYSAELVQVGDPLYVNVQIALGYTSAQMLDLFNAAIQVPK